MLKKVTIAVLFALALGTAFGQKLNVTKLDSLFQVLEINDKFMGSITISENGKSIYAKSIGKSDRETHKSNTSQTKYRIGSITKIFSSCMILKAVEENKLTLSQTIENYFPTIENAGKITIENLLNHRSGIHDFTGDEDYLGYYTEAKSGKQMLEIIAKRKSEFEPGSKAQYSNSNFLLLSFILEKTYNKPYQEILNEKIIKPLGLKSTYYGAKIDLQKNECYSYSFKDNWVKENETDMSIPIGAGAIVSNPADLVVFIENLFAHKIINAQSLELMLNTKDGYGLGIRHQPFFGNDSYGHSGGIDGFTSGLYYFPGQKLSIAITSNGSVYTTKAILKATASFYFGKEFKIPTFKTIELKSEELDQYIGNYSDPTLPLEINISKENTKLIAQSPGQSSIALEATEKNIFEFQAAGVKLEFKPGENQVILYQGGQAFTLTRK